MAPFASVGAAALLLVASASAHFTLRTPPSIGFDDSKEGEGPCGGFKPDFDKGKVTDFHVGGEPIGTSQSHPSARWLYRATLDQTATGGWTQLYPIVLQNSLGFMCQPSVPAPEAWVGKRGVVGVVANGDDGLLYQCAAVNFVSGQGKADGSTCQNSSSQIVFTSDPQLAALASGSISSPEAPPNNTASGGSGGASGGGSKPNSAAVAMGNILAVLAITGLSATYIL
ncbi:hypothetical protein GGTG_12819 [Gaeumannomyces tritici R3-111a-1]|uniref:Copper acquisition factor BIM1-like domain-containing protein n=1 Tax=Gaeumannomyces tritici (strain R3-111a-1) TaxID=644352 RepID=J3PH39_GAET3|nr:hypothetical protein GGTG_12819 [Gaeumannomyces tritici R3-111a-1]EJT69936.1 hypothetical protein GGTG_12819 [Gaeumannomyces tritici R3-111a-1]